MWNRLVEDFEHTKRRVQLAKQGMNHNQIDALFETEQEEMEQTEQRIEMERKEALIIQSEKEIEESLTKSKKDMIRRKILSGISELALETIREKEQREQIFRQSTANIEAISALIQKFESDRLKNQKRLQRLFQALEKQLTQWDVQRDEIIGYIGKLGKAIEGVEQTRNNLLESVKRNEASFEALRKKYLAKIDEANALIITYNEKILELNKWHQKKQEEYNREVARLNRLRR